MRSNPARGTRNVRPRLTTGRPTRPFVSRYCRASSYADPRPMRSTSAASSTVNTGGRSSRSTRRRRADTAMGRSSYAPVILGSSGILTVVDLMDTSGHQRARTETNGQEESPQGRARRGRVPALLADEPQPDRGLEPGPGPRLARLDPGPGGRGDGALSRGAVVQDVVLASGAISSRQSRTQLHRR